MLVTLGIYYVLPWMRFDRGGGLPDQAVLIDFANQRLLLGPLEIWPQEFYYVTGLLVISALGSFWSPPSPAASGAATPVRRPCGPT